MAYHDDMELNRSDSDHKKTESSRERHDHSQDEMYKTRQTPTNRVHCGSPDWQRLLE